MLTGLVLIIATLLFGIATFRAQENALQSGIDARLEATARLAKEILPADYHDKISGADSVSEAEYLRMVERWNRLCTQMGLEYIWSLMRIDGKTVFTSATSTSKDINKGDYARFFEMHSTPELYAAAFASMKPRYQINDNIWGRTKVVLLPFEDARGRPFLFGASMKTTAVDALTRKTIWQSLEISAGILFFGVFLSVLLAGSLVRPLEKLTDLARSITKGNWGQVVETSGAIEIRSLAHSVNEMSRSIQEKITERKRAEQEESLVNEIGRVVGSTLNINQVFERVATEVSKLLPYDRLLVNRKKNDNEFIVVYASGVDNPGRRLADSYPSQGTATGVVMATRKGILVQPMDAEEIKDLYPNLYATFKTGLRSTMTVPLISNDEMIGSMNIRSNKLKAYTEQDLRLAERIGMQVAGAIVNAQMFNDLSKTEKSLRESEERLQRAEKMEALGQMAGGVAHDLNNILGILSGYSELLLLEIPEGSRHRGHV
ncbi:MAG: HAMP domain-containing protein, partial [Deltaproteobacteria bacterium]